MTSKNIRIRKLSSREPIPYDLLLLADETLDAINKYIHESLIYIIESERTLVGVYALYSTGNESVEIKNIAVAEEFQNQGFGTLMLQDAERRAKELGFREIIIGTPDIAARQINLYQKVGFQKYMIKKNFFVDNYTKPIYENGKQLKDMVMLKKRFSPPD